MGTLSSTLTPPLIGQPSLTPNLYCPFQMGKKLFKQLSGIGKASLIIHRDPQVYQFTDWAGSIQWKAYDPDTQHHFTFGSETSARLWIENRHQSSTVVIPSMPRRS